MRVRALRRIARVRRSRAVAGRDALIQAVVATFAAVALSASGVVQLPFSKTRLEHSPIIVLGEPALHPVLVRAVPPLPRFVTFMRRAPEGEPIPVSLTQYCLQGETRRGRYVRPGIVAADPKVFPLARYVEVFLGDRYVGRFLVDDTGKNVIGNTLDIWNSNCREARRFGRQWGHAVLVARQSR